MDETVFCSLDLREERVGLRDLGVSGYEAVNTVLGQN